MSKVNDLSSNNASGQFSGADLTAAPKVAQNTPADGRENLQTEQLLNTNAKPGDLMAASQLINSTAQLRSDLARKFDGNNRANQTTDQSDDEKFERKNNLGTRHHKKISVKSSDSTTTVQALKQGLRTRAEAAGLSLQEQDDFVEEHAQKLTAQAEGENLGNLSERADDFSSLKLEDQLGQKLDSEIELLPNSPQDNTANPSSANEGGVSLRAETDLNPIANPRLSANSNQAFGLAQAVNSRQATNSNETASLAEAGLISDECPTASELKNSASQRAAIEARFPLPAQGSPEFETLANAIQKKIEAILQKLGLGSEENETSILGQTKAAKELHQVSEFLDAQKPHEAKDKGLFATAFGVATEASGQSRARHGDGVLLEFANYGDQATEADKGATRLALAKFLQHGTEAGYAALLKEAKADFSPTELKSLEQLKEKLGHDKTSNLVVGVVTMSVMTREVVEQLKQVSINSSLGLSDNALAALQKAHHSLRDHLTPTDIVGAVGNLKNAHIEIAGAHYNFLPEVSEALNSLREARSRILSETAYLKPDASGTDAQQRFVREAENLRGITERIENIMGI